MMKSEGAVLEWVSPSFAHTRGRKNDRGIANDMAIFSAVAPMMSVRILPRTVMAVSKGLMTDYHMIAKLPIRKSSRGLNGTLRASVIVCHAEIAHFPPDIAGLRAEIAHIPAEATPQTHPVGG
ncbi:MAG: hypothetical protein OXM87_02870 [Truepera sp.]|nr:hypothetical protein [Truepera sp.]